VLGNAHFSSFVDASHFVATSSSATTTLAGGFAVETSGLVYDHSTNRVGIGRADPRATLDVYTGTGFGENNSVIVGGVFPAVQFYTTSGGGSALQNWAIGAQWVSDEFYIMQGQSIGSDPRNNGTQRFVIESFGDVGIASTSPYAKLSVTNTGSGPSFVVEDSTSPDTTPFIIDASGNVGIGTTSPYQTLSVSGSAIIKDNNATLSVSNTNGPIERLHVHRALAPRKQRAESVELAVVQGFTEPCHPWLSSRAWSGYKQSQSPTH
jgi:hypothetical protein